MPHTEAEVGVGELSEPFKNLTSLVIGAAIEVHRELGPGLMEGAYAACLARELVLQKVNFRREVAVPVRYKGVCVEVGYRVDFLVEEAVVVELKAIRCFDPVHDAQLLSYLRLGGWKVGLLINFHERRLVDGVRRRVM